MPPKFDPEIEREMRIEPLTVPPDSYFEPKFTEEQMRDIQHENIEVLKIVSRVEQMVRWGTNEIVKMNEHMRRMEAEIIQSRGMNRFLSFARNGILIIVGGLTAEVVKQVAMRWFK